MLEYTKDFLSWDGFLLAFGILTLWLLKLEFLGRHAFLFVVATEIVAIAFSEFSAFVFTKVKFSDIPSTPNLGLIFLGVHICVGLTLLSVYLAQFGG